MCPIPIKIRDTFEQDLEDNLATVNLSYPPQHESFIPVNPTFLHINSWGDDLIGIQQQVNPVVAISYPSEDIPFLQRFIGDFGRIIKVPQLDFSRTDEVVASSDLVNDATEISFTFNINEYNIHHFEVHTSLPVGSTSRLLVELWDVEMNKKIAGRWFYNSGIGRNGWTRIDVGLSWWDPTKELKIVCKEFGDYGSDPSGIYISKNAASEYLFRVYSYEMTQMKSIWYSAIMKLSVFGKDKTVESDPEGQFISKERIASGIAQAIQNHIIKTWKTLQREGRLLSINPTRSTSVFLESEYRSDMELDVRISYLVSVPMETYKVPKSIEIKNLNLL